MPPIQPFWPGDPSYPSHADLEDPDDDDELEREVAAPPVRLGDIPTPEAQLVSINKRFSRVSPSVDGVGQPYDLTIQSPTMVRVFAVETNTAAARWELIAEAWPRMSADQFQATAFSQRGYLFLPDPGDWRIRFTLTASAVFNQVILTLIQESEYDVSRLAGVDRGGPSELASGTEALGIGGLSTILADPRVRRVRLVSTVGTASYRIGIGPLIAVPVSPGVDIDFDLMPMATISLVGGGAGGTVVWYATLD